uniref:Glucose regulated repressor protein n=1 Tax=Rhizophora mucronata TaxID=61149 RepID=A0A2P2Q487_RHIMU
MGSNSICINETLTDDELRRILMRLEEDKDKESFGLVCKRWLRLQSTERKRLAARAGPHMLQKMAARFSCLTDLDLSQSVSRSFFPGVTDSDLAVIAHGFKYLKVLNLHNCKGITDDGMVSIGRGLSSLQSLDVSNCRKLTDKGFSVVAEGCRDLQQLHLACCRFVTDRTLNALSKNCPSLEELGLQGCTNITDSGLTDLVNGCPKIHFLDVNKCINVGDSGISNVSKLCSSSLKTLKLLDCYKVGDESMLSLARFCKNLETLIIGGCRDISNDSMKSLAAACKFSLKNLRMDWCLNISDSSLSCILNECRNLEALDIGCCEKVTDGTFQSLGTMETELRLRVLKISNCPKITVTAVGLLLEKCRSLEYLDVRSCPLITKSDCEEAGIQFPEYFKVNFAGSLNEPDILI